MKNLNFKWLIPLILSIFVSTSSFASPSLITITHKKDIKVVYDINQNQITAGIGEGLYFVRGLLESYKKLGVPMKQLHIVVMVHGAAAYWLLDDKAYQDHTGNPFDNNPNDKVVRELIDHGVSIEVCNVTLRAHHWNEKDLLPGVKRAFDAYTRMIDLQMQGYAYIKYFS